MSLHAIIMAGGEGVRLRPLTCCLPKPLVPLAGEPVMGYALKLLKRHGILDATATLCYQPRKIREAFGRGENYGVRLHYYEETAPLGTAGGVKAAAKQEEAVVVLSGDGLTDADLTAAIAFHQAKKAAATLVLKRSEAPLAYGVVMTGRDGRVERFIEKPSWQHVYSDLVNTGIYILDKAALDFIPARGTPDFGRDVFPAMLKSGLPVYGFETDGYWCDVGDRRACLAAERALLRGEVHLPCEKGVSKEAHVDPSAIITGDYLIGVGAVIGAGARIDNSVIGEHAVVGAGAVIEYSCLWQNAVAETNARVSGAILCTGAAARRNAIIAEGCAVGARAVIGADAALSPGVCVYPALRVPEGAVIEQSLTAGGSRALLFTEDGAECLSPGQACEAADGLLAHTRARTAAVAWDGEGEGMARVLAGALTARGAETLTLGEGTRPMLAALTRAYRADVGIFCEHARLRFLDARGEAFTKSALSAIENKLLRGETSPPAARTGALMPIDGKTAHALACLPPKSERALWTPLAVICDNPVLRESMIFGLKRMDARAARVASSAEKTLRSDEIGLYLSPDGMRLTPCTERLRLGEGQRDMLLLRLCLLSGAEKIYALPGVPRAAAQLAPLVPPDDSDMCLRQKTIMTDGAAAAFVLMEALKTRTFDMLIAELPPLFLIERAFPCDARRKSEVMRRAGETALPHGFAEGVWIDHGAKSARIVPDAACARVRVIAEAASAETADELCDFYAEKFRRDGII